MLSAVSFLSATMLKHSLLTIFLRYMRRTKTALDDKTLEAANF